MAYIPQQHASTIHSFTADMSIVHRPRRRQLAMEVARFCRQ